jgi:2-keto-3-deoxy-L-rhamnonate aldolase RhmA
MGLIGQVDHPEVQKALADAAKACAAAGKPAGILASGAKRAADYAEYGYNWVAAGSDLGLMMGAARGDVGTLRGR